MESRIIDPTADQSSTILTVDQACDLVEEFHLLPVIKNDELYTRLVEMPHRLKIISCLLKSIDSLANNGDDPSQNNLYAQQKDELDKLSNSLCTDLNIWMEYVRFESVKVRDRSYSFALFSAALTLANINPINSLDPISQEVIDPNNRVVTTDRYQHDILNLVKWLKVKSTNPFTGLNLSEMNLKRLISLFNSRFENGSSQIDLNNSYSGGDPNVEDTLPQHSVYMPSSIHAYSMRSAMLSLLQIYVGSRQTSWMASHSFPTFFNVPRVNAMMIDSITQLNGLLAPSHFDDWPSNNRFTSSHRDALIYLIREENYLPQDAVNFIKDMDADEVVVFSMPLRPLSPGFPDNVD